MAKTGAANGPPLQPGTGVVVYRPDLKGLRADITSYEAGSYEIHLRGAPSEDVAIIEGVKQEDLKVVDCETEHRGNEDHRKNLLELAADPHAPVYIRNRVRAMTLADEIGFTLLSNQKELSPVSPELTFRTHVPIVQEYYISQNWCWPLPNTARTQIVLSLKGYVDASISDPFEIRNLEEQLSRSYKKARWGKTNFDVNLLFAAVVYATLGSFFESGAGPGSAGGSVKALTLQIEALWRSYKILTGKKSSSIRAAIDKRFASEGASDFTHQHMLWCICCLYIQRSKDLRICYPNHRRSKSPSTIDRLVKCAKTAIHARPENPHSYFVCACLLMDTQNMCRRSDGPPRYRLACEYAMHALTLAEASGDPFYLFLCHLFAAYWKMTSAYEQPRTQRDIRDHVDCADDFEAKCRSYTVRRDLRRGTEMRAYIRNALLTFRVINPTYDEEDEVHGPITMAPFEQNNPRSRVILGIFR